MMSYIRILTTFWNCASPPPHPKRSSEPPIWSFIFQVKKVLPAIPETQRQNSASDAYSKSASDSQQRNRKQTCRWYRWKKKPCQSNRDAIAIATVFFITVPLAVKSRCQDGGNLFHTYLPRVRPPALCETCILSNSSTESCLFLVGVAVSVAESFLFVVSRCRGRVRGGSLNLPESKFYVKSNNFLTPTERPH